MPVWIGLGFLALVMEATASAQQSFTESVCPACDARDRYRWPVKILMDRDRQEVKLEPVHEVTVKWLVSQPRPGGGEAVHPRDKRVDVLERQVFRVTALLQGILPFGDRDVHLFLRDPDDSRHRMIAEVIDPDCYRRCVPGSREADALIARLSRARQVLLAAPFFRPEIKWFDAGGVTVTVTGVGFFDRPSPVLGAGSGIELHPVLDLVIH